MQFRDIPGQQNIKSRLVNSLKTDRISHAQLFGGTPGTGQLAMALAYAAYLNCVGDKDEDSCGTCSSCVKMKKYVHPDLHFVFPVIKKPDKNTSEMHSDLYIGPWRDMLKENPYFGASEWFGKISSDNKQGMIYVGESPRILNKMQMKSYEGEYKIMIIWLPEKMHPSVANKLLKILEEPPVNSVFILISEVQELLLPTITSRCQIVKFPPFTREDIKSEILKKNPGSEQAANSAAMVANGNMNLAFDYFYQAEKNEAYLAEFRRWMLGCYKKEVVELLQWSEEMAKNTRERQKDFLLFSLRMIRENFNMGINGEKTAYLSAAEADFSQKFNRFVHSGNSGAIHSEIELAIRHISQNVNSRMVFYDLAIKCIPLLTK